MTPTIQSQVGSTVRWRLHTSVRRCTGQSCHGKSVFSARCLAPVMGGKTLYCLVIHRLVPTGIGCSDVLSSTTTDRPHVEEHPVELEPPVINLNLKKVRRELPDEDIRRMAISKLRDVIMQDPMATQLGVSICNQSRFGAPTALAEQSINDCFRMKASSTLQKRAGSL